MEIELLDLRMVQEKTNWTYAWIVRRTVTSSGWPGWLTLLWKAVAHAVFSCGPPHFVFGTYGAHLCKKKRCRLCFAKVKFP